SLFTSTQVNNDRFVVDAGALRLAPSSTPTDALPRVELTSGLASLLVDKSLEISPDFGTGVRGSDVLPSLVQVRNGAVFDGGSTSGNLRIEGGSGGGTFRGSAGSPGLSATIRLKDITFELTDWYRSVHLVMEQGARLRTLRDAGPVPDQRLTAAGGEAVIDTNGQTLTVLQLDSQSGGTVRKTGLGTLEAAFVDLNTIAIDQGTVRTGTPDQVGEFVFDGSSTGGIPTLEVNWNATTSSPLQVNRSARIDVSTPLTTLNLTGSLRGGSSLTKIGPGTLALSGSAVEWQGFLEVADGVLDLALGSALDRFVAIGENGTLRLTRAGTLDPGVQLNAGNGSLEVNASNPLRGIRSGSATISGSHALELVAGGSGWFHTGSNGIVSTDVKLSGTPDSFVNFQIGQDNVLRLQDVLSTESAGLRKTGAGTLALVASDLTRDIRLEQGVLELGGPDALDQAGNASLQFIGGTLQPSFDGAAIGRVSLQGTGSRTISLSDGLTATATRTITGTAGLEVTGVGTLEMLANNSFSGGLRINDGATVKAATDAVLGASGAAVTFDGGTLVTTSNFRMPSGRPIVMGDSGGAFAPEAGTRLEVDTFLQGAGGLTVGGDGVVRFNVNNSHDGGTAIDGGTLEIANANMLGDPLAPFSVGLTSGGTLRLRGGGLEGLLTRQIVVGSGGGVIDVGDRDWRITGALGGSGALTKTGPGKLQVDGGVGPGDLTVAGGTLELQAGSNLLINGDLHVAAGSRMLASTPLAFGGATWLGDVTLEPDATLETDLYFATFAGDVRGAGTITAAITGNTHRGSVDVEPSAAPVEAQTLTSSSSNGTLTFSDGVHNFTSSTELILDLGAGGAEQIHVSEGAELKLDGTLVLRMLPTLDLSPGEAFTLFKGDGTWSGEFDAITLLGDAAGLSVSGESLLQDGRIVVVPEPSGLVVFLLATGAAMARRNTTHARRSSRRIA
ncbi:MAG: autotransporter-associated beta strand repeat-containing protein, partial [Phycisphaeraceae bacterium]